MRNNLADVVTTLRSARLSLFFIAVLLFLVAVIIISYRLKIIFSGQNINLSLKEALYLSFIGFFFNNFLPSAVGGDIVKAYYAALKTNKKLESFTSVFMDRFFGLFPLIFIAGASLLFVRDKLQNNSLVWLVIGLLILTMFAILFLLNKNFAKISSKLFLGPFKIFKITEKLKKVYDAIGCYKNQRQILLYSFISSITAQVIAIVAVWISAFSLSINEIPFGMFFIVVPLVAIASMFPSLNGLGVRESAYVFFLKDYTTPQKALAISILWLGVLLVMSIIGGFLYLFRHKVYKISEA